MTQALLTAEPSMTSTGHVVESRDVVMRFGDKEVLDQVSLAVALQERLVIIGQSGTGKTTILRLILGILKPNAGVPVDTCAVAGFYPTSIYQNAARKGADLIIMSTHGRTGLRRALIGSVAEGIVRNAACPVLVVPSFARVREELLNERTRGPGVEAPLPMFRKSAQTQARTSSSRRRSRKS
jgi:energy-coupling factor transporter ATP-binding protein EcfA2